ncbi:MAG: FkbM family methyltransferase [Bacteroidetes bacterium]|nr:FkbM family methyltransferase [Bacteroidota bacterium]
MDYFLDKSSNQWPTKHFGGEKMRVFLESLAKKVHGYLSNEYKREYTRLLIKWGKYRRYETRRNVRFLNYKFTVPDLLTFLGQFQEIFVKESYRFTAATDEPLIIDCGANIGMSCLYFKKTFPSSKVVAFEADPKIFSILTENLNNSGIHDVELVNKAVWIDDNGIRFSVEGADGGSIYGNNNLIEVQTLRLKDFLESFSSIDLLKIDIEGAEDKVVLDCEKSLDRVKNIFIEYHSWTKKEQKLGEILAVLESNKFRYQLESSVPREAPLVNHHDESSIDLHVNVYGYRKE